MMQRSVRAAFYAILTGLLAVSGLAAGVTAANANVAGFCTASSTATTKANCMIIHTISNPATVMLNVRVTKGANQFVSTTWTASCTLGGDTEKNFGGEAGTTPITETLILPFPDQDSCAVTTSATLGTNNGTMAATLSYAPDPNATPSSSSGPARAAPTSAGPRPCASPGDPVRPAHRAWMSQPCRRYDVDVASTPYDSATGAWWRTITGVNQ